jgi:hypothetical protein
VARQKTTYSAVSVPPLISITDAEKRYFDYGAIRRQKRRSMVESSLIRIPPSEEESHELHSLYLNHMESHKENSFSSITINTAPPPTPQQTTPTQRVILMRDAMVAYCIHNSHAQSYNCSDLCSVNQPLSCKGKIVIFTIR